MTNNNRRQFLGAAGKVGLGLAAATVVKAQPALPGNNRSLQPKWLLKGTASLCRPSLAPSQLSFRIGLARTRTSSYPLDSMDFIMIDLERPPGCSRHAYWCTGDLTGRLLDRKSVV